MKQELYVSRLALVVRSYQEVVARSAIHSEGAG